MNTPSSPRRPLLRYHGGKWVLAPWIISHFPPHRVYVEPFGGAASVLMRKPRSYAEVYNEMDGEVVNLFRVLQDLESAAELIRLIELTPFARDEFKLAYHPTEDTIERARRMCVRSHMGFGSDIIGKATSAAMGFRPGTGFRANSKRSGTTPAHDWANFPPALTAIVERFRGVVIENRDAIRCIEQHDTTETLIYADPPYIHTTRSKHRGNYAHEMTEADHEQLLQVLQAAKGYVVLSGYQHPIYETLGWKRSDRNAYADGAKKRVESIWLNPRAEKMMGMDLWEG